MLMMPFTLALPETRRRATVDDPAKIAAQIARYWARFHKRLAALAAISDRHADLLASFPAAAIAIVSRQTSEVGRQEALCLVAEGAPLAHVAHALGLPLWFRKLPPEALGQPLAERLPRGLRDPSTGARLLNIMPDATGRQDRWLQAVTEAFVFGDEEAAVWLGGQRIFRLRRLPAVPVLPLMLYRWYAQHPELPAGSCLPRTGNLRMGLGRAAAATRQWLNRVLQDHCGGAALGGNDWCTVHAAQDLTFVPLLTSEAIVAEGVAMAHCVATYVPYVVHGHCRLYSLRRDDKRIATMEVRVSEQTARPHINQIKAVHNTVAAKEVWEAAAAWLAERTRHPDHLERFRSSHHCSRAFREQVWAPYAASLRPAADGSQPPAPGIPDILKALRELAMLERC